MKENHVVIMAGGIGSRFWPMSTPEFPKQFIDVLGVGRSMIQMTVDRFRPLCSIEHMWVVTSEKYVDIVKNQIPELPIDNILPEPEARNTAPCIAYACWKISQHHPNANIVVTPSDAVVLNPNECQRVIGKALEFTADSHAIVTVGIKPSRPETGYGYIKALDDGKIRKVEAFKEKPDLPTAWIYFKNPNYFWNAGIFVWNVDTITHALRTYAPQIAEVMDQIAPSFYTSNEIETLKKLFPTCEKISIDYAVMEKSPDIYTIPADFGWSDLGTWGSLRQNTMRDEAGNALVGSNVRQYNCEDCVVHVGDLNQVVIEGLKDYIVAEKNGRLLICRLSEEQRIKEFSK